MEEEDASETLVPLCQITRRFLSEKSHLDVLVRFLLGSQRDDVQIDWKNFETLTNGADSGGMDWFDLA
jgi:hypothetical protein